MLQTLLNQDNLVVYKRLFEKLATFSTPESWLLSFPPHVHLIFLVIFFYIIAGLLFTIGSIYQVSLGVANTMHASYENLQFNRLILYRAMPWVFWYFFTMADLENFEFSKFNNAEALFVMDYYAWYCIFLIKISTLLIMRLARNYTSKVGKDNIELGLLFLFTVLFMGFLLTSIDLMTAFISLEGLSFTLYVLAAMNLTSQASIEAAIKYFCLGGVSSGVMLFGISMIYGLWGSTNFVLIRLFLKETLTNFDTLIFFNNQSNIYLTLILFCIIFGFLFKLSAFPCHVWTPDVYEGSPLLITAFFATVVKLAIYLFFLRLISFVFYYSFPILKTLLIFSAIGSLIIGCFGALVQKKIKRFIAYTSINQMGFILLGFSYNTYNGFCATTLHMLIYLVMSFGLFAFLLGISTNQTNANSLAYISDLRYLGKKFPLISLAISVIFFSMAGIPPLGGFFGKYLILLAGVESNHNYLVVLTLFINIISTFYYIRLIKNLWFGTNTELKKKRFFFDSYEHSIYSHTLGGSLLILMWLPYFLEWILEFCYLLQDHVIWV